MSEQSFFVVCDPVSARPYRAEFVEPPPTEISNMVAILRGTQPPRWVFFRRSSGGAPADVIWTEISFVFLVSERVVTALESAGLSGWTAYPVDVSDIADARYFGLAIRGRCGASQYSSGSGLRIDPETWDGSDVFMPDDESALIFLSEQGARVFREARVKNIMIVPFEEFDIL